jgi:hypothetical protein
MQLGLDPAVLEHCRADVVRELETVVRDILPCCV